MKIGSVVIGSLLVLSQCKKATGDDDDHSTPCENYKRIPAIPSGDNVTMTITSILGIPANSTAVTDFVKSSGAEAYDLYQCTYKSAVNTGDGVGFASVIVASGLCAANSSDCAAMALYEGSECDSAEMCNMDAGASFTADCSGIDPDYPSCKISCQDNSSLVDGISSCVEGYVSPNGSPTSGGRTTWRMFNAAALLLISSLILMA